jgi:hypothetical protein
MKGENIMTEEKTDMRILKRGTCPSLSGRSELTHEYGYYEKSKTILFRIADNTDAGQFQDDWTPLDAIISTLEKAKGPFSLSVFKSLYSGKSINNTGFLGAALKKQGLIICEKRQYLKKDTKASLSDINKLIKGKTIVKKASKRSPKC